MSLLKSSSSKLIVWTQTDTIRPNALPGLLKWYVGKLLFMSLSTLCLKTQYT